MSVISNVINSRKMKITLILIINFIFTGIYVNAQINLDYVFKYFDEDCTENYFYQDKIITNASERSWPALGMNTSIKTFYYQYNTADGYTLNIISDDVYLAAMHYIEYYIYNELQELEYYIYQSEFCGGIVIKFNKYNFQIVEKSEDTLLAENYFIDIENIFNPDNIKDRAKENLSYCKMLFGMPIYEDQTEYIRSVYKEINSMNDLVEKKVENCIYYYKNDDLVKVIAKIGSNREYYIDKGKLVFAYYPKALNEPEIRVYFYNEEAYKVIEGKENLYKSSDNFNSYSNKVKYNYSDIIEKL